MPMAVVLSGGGLRGIAHIGVVGALEGADLYPRWWAGSSVGAIVGAAAALGWDSWLLTALARAACTMELFPVSAFALLRDRDRATHVCSPAPLQRFLADIFGEMRLHAALARGVSLRIVATDVETGAPVVFNEMEHAELRLRDAIYASCALPGLLPPLELDGRLLMDGGMVNNLPIDTIPAQADAVLAVQLPPPVTSRTNPTDGLGAIGFALHGVRAAMQAATAARLAAHRGAPLRLVEPRVAVGYSVAARDVDAIVQSGYDATVRVLRNAELRGVPTTRS